MQHDMNVELARMTDSDIARLKFRLRHREAEATAPLFMEWLRGALHSEQNSRRRNVFRITHTLPDFEGRDLANALMVSAAIAGSDELNRRQHNFAIAVNCLVVAAAVNYITQRELAWR